MTKAQLVKEIVEDTGCSEAEAERMVDSVIKSITSCLAYGTPAELHPLGRWLVVEEPEHAGTDPNTHAPIVIAATKRVLFHPSQALKDAVNAGGPAPE